MKKLILFLLLIPGVHALQAQTDSIALYVDSCQCGKDNLIVDFAEEMPGPAMGWSEWQAYIKSNLQLADSSLRKGPGKVYVSFVIDLQGNVCSSFVRKGCAEAPEFDNEALRIVRETKWTPGKMNGRSVCVRMTVPIQICLTE